MYSSYSAAALALRTAKPSYNSHSSYLPSHHCQRYDGDGGQRELLPLNAHLFPRFLLDGYLLRHSTHLLLLSSRIRPPPPPHPPHCFRQRAAARCCCSGGYRSGRSGFENVYWRPEARGHRCCGQGTGSSDLGMVRRQLKARGCGCGSSGSGRLGLGTSCGHRDTPRLLGRAVRQEVWEYDGGEWPHRGCSMECRCDWEEEEEGDECGFAQREVPGRSLLRRRWKEEEEEDGDRCRDCRRRKGVEIDYCDEGEYNGHRREMRDVNGVHGKFLDSNRRRLEQRGYYGDDDDLHTRRRREMIGRERRDFELDDAFDMKRVGSRRYSENDRKYDWRRERRDSECEDVFDAGRVRAGRYTEDDRRFDRRRERMDFEIDSDDDMRIEERHHRNNDERYVMRNPRRKEDRAEVVSLLESHRWHDNECDNDDQDIAGQKHYSGRFPRSASALRKDDSQRTSSSRNTVDTRLAREDSALRVRWHDNVDRRAAQTLQERDQQYSSSVGWSNDEYDCDDAQLIRARDSRRGTQDVKVITEDDTRLISSSKNTSVLKHGSNVDQQIAARKDESKKISQRIMETSEVRGHNTELDSATRSSNQEDRRNCIDNKSSSLQSSVKMTSDSRRQINQHDKVDQSVVAFTESRTNSEKLTDIKMDSGHNVSRASHSERNYEEVNQMDLNDRSTSIENITHITRDKKRYVNQQVIHETDIDVQNVSHVDVSKVRASDILVSRTSQNQSETRSDVNSISNVSAIDRARGQQEQIHQNEIIISDSPTVRGSQSHLGTGVYGQVHLTSVIDSTKEMQEQVENTIARTNNAAMPSTSESHIPTRTDGQFQPSSSVNTVGSVEQQIDLTKIHDSDTVFVSNSYNRSDHEARRTKPVNLVDKARDSHDKNDQKIRGGSSTERSDQSRTKFSESFQDSRETLTRVEETGRLMQHNMALNSQQAGNSRISDDKDTTSLEMESSEEASIFNADIKQQAIIHGGRETTAGQSMLGVSSARKSASESLLESAARLEKSSTFHVGQFVGELQRGLSDADTTLTKKNEKSIMEGTMRSSSRSRMKGPSDEIWDVQSATSQETFKTADKEEGSSADGGTNSASQTPKSESVIAKRVHKSLWAYVADIVRLGWVQRGESHDPRNKSFNKSSSSNSQSTEGWLSSQGHDNDRIQKRNWGTKPKEHQLMKSQSGESESRLASALKDENLPTGTQGLQISEAGHVPEVGSSKGDFVPRISKDAVQISGERVKAEQSEGGASSKGNIKGGLAEASTSTSVDVTVGHLPEHEAAISSSITTKRSTEINVGKGILGGASSTINADEVGQNDDKDNWRYGPSAAITPYHHPQTQAMVPHDNMSYTFLESAELPTGGFTRMEEKIVVQQAPEVIRTEGKDAELKRRKIQRNKQVLKETFDEWEEAYQHDAKQRKTDELFMREALLEAQRAADIWEVPVGAVLVHNGEIIARGCNLVEDLRDSTAHAEICCIREASNKLKTWRLAETTLYVTLEPCAMCAGAILQARVDTVVWGAPNKLLGADGSWVRLFPGDGQASTLDPTNQNQTAGPVHPFHPKIIVRRGVLSAECSEIMQQFFQLRRKKKQRPESPPRARHSGHHHHPIKFFTKMHHMFGTVFCL